MAVTPVGDACSECYTNWKLHHSFRDGCDTFQSFCHLNDTDRDMKKAVDRSITAAATEQKEFPQEGAQISVNQEVVIRRSFVVLNEAELIRQLGVVRLTKNLKDKLSSFCMPPSGEGGSGEGETLYAFQNPQQPFRTAEVCVGRLVSGTVHSLLPPKSAWEGESEVLAAKRADEMYSRTGATAVLAKLANKSLYTVEGFCVANGKAPPKPLARSASASDLAAREATVVTPNPSDEGELDEEAEEGASDGDRITGPAASEYSAPSGASPTKSLPRVPAFPKQPSATPPKKDGSVSAKRSEVMAPSDISSGRGDGSEPGEEDPGDDDG